MHQGGYAPEKHRDCITDPSAKSVDEPADSEHSQRVGHLKQENQVTVIDFTPMELRLKDRLQDTENLPIHIVLRGSEKKNCANHPTKSILKDSHPYICLNN